MVAAAVAMSVGSKALGFGYTGYQSMWPEQTPIATAHLEAVLGRHGIRLLLPVYDLTSLDAAIRELQAYGISQKSLEQKCIQQLNSVSLPDNMLKTQISTWERAYFKQKRG